MAGEMRAPVSYNRKVGKLLQTIAQEEARPQRSKNRKKIFQLAVCLTCVFLLLSLYTINVRANIFASFRQTIMDFLTGNSNEDPGEAGVGSSQIYVASRPDLIMELTEKVIDRRSIYLLVTMTAPNNIQFAENISFDYFCFCRGQNYNVDQLIGGATSCELLEVNEDMPNRATYVVSLATDEELEEGSDITVCFLDLTADPYTDHSALLISGVWSMTFPVYRTVTDNILVEGNPDMSFSYINTTAAVKSVELTPLGMVLISDISNFPADELGISDTRIVIRLRLIDGTELNICDRDPEVRTFCRSAFSSFIEEDNKMYQQDTVEFESALHIDRVLGVYIEDLYFPVK